MDKSRDIDAALTKLLTKKPVFCSLCRGRMVYVGRGAYKCEKCEHEELDDFGKVRQYLEENGPMPALVIAQATG
ncbi:MAG: hypothetical protein K2M91_14235, partial [Lachnospiraceae bacterium]|nr:hypothetical protein [Lachnospiraceae bacterium]